MLGINKANKTANMEKIQKIFLVMLLSAFSFQGFTSPSFDIPVKIFKAIEVGNVENLNEYFNESIELILPSNEGIYSKSQATQILKDFYHKHRPESFNVLHQGGSENAKYAIGNLITDNGEFRVHFLVKMKNGKPLIHQLRIQEE